MYEQRAVEGDITPFDMYNGGKDIASRLDYFYLYYGTPRHTCSLRYGAFLLGILEWGTGALVRWVYLTKEEA